MNTIEVPSRKNKFFKNYDRTFFEKIDSHEKAYWLGFIYADGSVCRNMLQICINDKEHLIHFKNAIKGTQKIRRDRGMERFSISSKALMAQMAKLGITPRKSLTLTFPTEEMVPKEFLNSFCLGYFDGDGSIQRNLPKTCKNYKWYFSVISTQDFCEKYGSLLAENCGLYRILPLKYQRIPEKNIWEVHVCGVYKDRAERIYNWLYKDYKHTMIRKKSVFETIIERHQPEPYSSQYRGVSLCKKTNKWRAQIKKNGKGKILGEFNNEEEAARCYDKNALLVHGEKAILNFP